MKSFTVIFECGEPVAFLVEHSKIKRSEIACLLMLTSDRFYYQDELAKRWNLLCALSTNEWAKAQLRRVPMIRPKGDRLAFVEEKAS